MQLRTSAPWIGGLVLLVAVGVLALRSAVVEPGAPVVFEVPPDRPTPRDAIPLRASDIEPRGAVGALVEAVRAAEGVCPTGPVRAACDASSCVLMLGPAEPWVGWERLARRPSLVLDLVAPEAAWNPSPCARGRRLLARPELQVEILSSFEGWTCFRISEAGAIPGAAAEPLSTCAALRATVSP